MSLTSYPARFRYLHLTLKSLLHQSIKPDRILLWIADDDIANLPPRIIQLSRHGIDIRPYVDIRSYKKIVGTLETFPHAFIVTADDDIYYHPQWLAGLADSYLAERADVICHRARRIRIDDRGRPLSYTAWPLVSQPTTSPDLLPTGAGGVLYAPGTLDVRVTCRDMFTRLCPTGDDLWLYWMARLAGATIRTTGQPHILSWIGSQQSALWQENGSAGKSNDRHVNSLIAEFGIPSLIASQVVGSSAFSPIPRSGTHS